MRKGYATADEAAECLALLDALRMDDWVDDAQRDRVLRWLRVRREYISRHIKSSYMRGHTAGRKLAPPEQDT